MKYWKFLYILIFIFSSILIASKAKANHIMEPFLALPFSKDIPLDITEGWIYSDQERSIHGISSHRAIDFAMPEGTPIYAAASGYAVSATQISYLDRTYQGKKIGYSRGNFVEIWHPEQKVLTRYLHLSHIQEDIPYGQEIENTGKFVRQGELIGWSGSTGLAWGCDEAPNPTGDENKKCPTWDEDHLHFEVFRRNSEGKKDLRFDPFEIYKDYTHYKDFDRTIIDLWLKEEDGSIKHATK